MASHGSEKVSSGPSESSGSSGMSSGSSDYNPPWPPDDSSSSSSSSCQCGFEVIEIVLAENAQDGHIVIENTGCGPVTITEFFHSISGDWTPALPVTIPEGGIQLFEFDGEADIRLTFVTIVADCGEPVIIQWPQF